MTHGLATCAALLVALAAASPASAASRAVQLRTSDGIGLAAALYDAPTGPAPAVVLVHMLTRTKEDWREFAERLQATGITALALDLRGHGQSEGAAAPTSAMALDVRAALGWLAGRSEVKSGSVAIVGASIGATLALMAAAEVPSVRGVALLSPAADYRGLRLDAAGRRYGGRPMFLAASAEDPYALRTIKGLVSETQPAHEQRVSAIVAHGSHLIDRDPDVASALVDWLRRTLSS